MSHLLLRSHQTREGKETLYDKRGRIFGKYESRTDATRAAKLISGTSEARPRPKPQVSHRAAKADKKAMRGSTHRKTSKEPRTIYNKRQWRRTVYDI